MELSARIVSDLTTIDPQDWERLNHADNPFLSHAFLSGLESSGSINRHVGWQPHHLALYEGGHLAAFAPSYIKTNSHGEFVFDWAWADAYHRNRLPYYPKHFDGSLDRGRSAQRACRLRMKCFRQGGH